MKDEEARRLKGQIIVITGASEGIGRATALALAKEGASLVLAARTIENLERTASEIREKGNRVLAIPTDVTRPEEVEVLAQKAIAAFGQVDIWINNVGRGLRKPFLETTEEDWNQLVATNLSSVLYGCRAVLPSMEQRVGEANLAAYSAVKHGVIGLTRALAEEEGAKGIHVNAICPGSVRTERMERLLPHVDKSSWLSPEDVAATIAFLACSAGYTMQGQSVDMY